MSPTKFELVFFQMIYFMLITLSRKMTWFRPDKNFSLKDELKYRLVLYFIGISTPTDILS